MNIKKHKSDKKCVVASLTEAMEVSDLALVVTVTLNWPVEEKEWLIVAPDVCSLGVPSSQS